jgi:hypothetical protein
MKSHKRVFWIAVAIVCASAANLVAVRIAGSTQLLAAHIVRFCLTCVIAFYLAKGKNWARWLHVTLLGAAFIYSVVSFFVYFADSFDEAPFIMTWVLVLGLFYGIIGAYLAFSKRVSQECRPEPPGLVR